MPSKKQDREYNIKFIPSDGAAVRNIHISARLLKYGIISLLIGAILLVAMFGFTGYIYFSSRGDKQTIVDLQTANALQQEKLTELAQKAAKLQDGLDKLNATEKELKLISNVAVDTTDDSSSNGNSGADNGGQGGPFIAPNIQNLTYVLDNLERRIAIHQENLENLREALTTQQQGLAAEAGTQTWGQITTRPYGLPGNGSISSPYGFRWNGTDFHPGVDIACDYGSPIRATADGTVITAGWNSGGYGNMVDIDHGNGIVTRYGHASSVVVSAGQYVRRGQVIAYVGSTGYSTGPHVHYEIRVNDRPVDPLSY